MTLFNPYLYFSGNAEEAFNFYKSIFGGEFTSYTRYGDIPMPNSNLSEEDRGKLMHIALPIGNGQALMGSDMLVSFRATCVAGNNFSISIHPDSKEEADRLFSRLSDGGKIGMPMAEQMWGDYHGNLRDKFDVNWMINYHKEA